MALRITIAYIVIGCTWVLLGDFILEFLMGKQDLTSEEVFVYNIVKGLLYIFITGLALYFFTNRAFRVTSAYEKQYRTLFEDNPNPMWVYDIQTHKILAANKAAIANYGCSKEEFLNLALEDLRLPEDIPVMQEHVEKALKGHVNSGIFRHKKKNGELFYVNIFSNYAIFNKQKARLIMALDVTDKKIAEDKNILLTKNLSDYKERLDNILNTANDVVYTCSPDFRVSFISDASEKLYGYTSEEFYTRDKLWDTLVHPDDRETTWEQMKTLLLTGNYGGEYRIINRAGELRYVYDKAAVKYDENGQPVEVFGIVTDITDLRESEQKFKNYSERIAYILDNITDGFITFDRELRFTFMNKAAKTITGVQGEEFLGKKIFDIYPQLTKAHFFEKIQEALGGTSVNFEEQFIERGRWFHFNIYPSSEGLALYVTDTTETHKMQEEITRTQNNLNALINNTPDFIWSIDREFRLQAINTPYRMFFQSFMGFDIKEGDLMLFDHFGDEIREKWLNHYERGLAGKYFVVEDEFEMPAMGKIYFETAFNPIRDVNGEVVGLGCFSRDITLQKMTEMRISEQNRKLLEISWMQSHEIRGPLSVIMGLTNLFNHDNYADPENSKIIEMLEKASKNLDDVVSKIVDKSHEARKENQV